MTRRLESGVIQGFIDYTENTEVPDVFSFWTGVSTVSATLGRDCFFEMGHFDIFPNLYIVLVAGSAVCRKSSAIAIANKLIRTVEPKIHLLSQKMTPEGMIGALSGMSPDGEQMLINEASGIAVVDELSTLIDKRSFDSGMISILTKLYDCDDFSYLTLSRGDELVKNPCLSILGGSTLHWIKGCIPPTSIGGGFTSRVIFVYRETNPKRNPFPTTSNTSRKILEDISHDLNEITKMRGSFALTDEARNMLVNEYEDFMNNSPMLVNPNLTGYAGRRHTSMIKVCMALSAARNDSRLIDILDVTVALKAMKSAERYMPKVLLAISSEFVGEVHEEVLNIIIRSKTVPRHELVRKTKHRLTIRQLDVILEGLMEEQIVKAIRDGEQVRYSFVGDKI